MIYIISDKTDLVAYSDDGWQFTNPNAQDYAEIAKHELGVGSFTVYYDNIAVCGRISA